MELWKYYRILLKRRWLIIIGTLICVGIVAVATYITPLKYEAYTTITERMSSSDKVDIFSVPSYGAQMDPQMRLSNLTQLIRSQTVIQRTAEELDRLGVTRNPVEILRTLNVQPIGTTMLLAIQVQANSDEEAIATADQIAKQFINFYDELNRGRAASSREFIEKQLPIAEAKLDKAREALRRFKEENDVTNLDRQTDMLLSQLSQFQTTLNQNEVQVAQLRSKVTSVEKELNKYPEFENASRVIAKNPVWQELKGELTRQEIVLQTMLKEKTPEHWDVQLQQKNIDEIKKKLAGILEIQTNSTTESKNPIYQSLMQNYAAAIIDLASMQAACTGAQQVIDSIKPKLNALPEKEKRYTQLNVNIQTATNTYALLQTKLDEAKIKEKEAGDVSAVQIVDPAQVRAADPLKSLKMILAVILGLMLTSGIAFLLNYMDNSVKTPAEVEELLKLPVTAVVPITGTHSLADAKYLPEVGEAYQMLSANLWINSREMETRTILVASADPDVGRSTTAANLAITLARDGAKVILVDSDLRQPSLDNIFKVDNDKGLSNILVGQLSLKDALKPTSVKDLMLITSGPLPANPIRLLRSPEMANFITEVDELADFVIFDSPSGTAFADSTILAALVKNVVIVYAAGTVPRGAEAEFCSRLEQVQANLLGTVLNMVNPEDSHGYYYFKSAYEELLKNVKYPAAITGSTQSKDEE